MPTAYLSPSLLQDLTNVSVSPGAGNTGYPLVWNNATGRFELAVLGVAGGGTGTSNGSITGTGALTFAAGGTNQPITLTPTGTASAKVIGNAFEINQPAVNTAGFGLSLTKGAGFFGAVNGTGGAPDFWPIFFGSTTIVNPGLSFVGWQGLGQDNSVGVIWFSARNQAGSGTIAGSHNAFVFSNFTTPLLTLRGNGDAVFSSSTESTSVTTGAVRIAGGLGVAGNTNIGGNLRFAGGTVPATATSAGTAGNIRYDGNHLYICTATNTWVRTALSTW